MRAILMSAIVATTGLRMCEAEEQDAPPPPPPVAAHAEVSVAAELMEPRFGGEVVIVEDHAVEVVPTADGDVYAYVAMADGTVPEPSGVQLSVHVHVQEGGVRPVTLVWDPAQRRYHGRVRGAVLAPGPAEVMLVAGGRPRRARVKHVAVVPRARVAIIGPGAPPGVKVWVHVPGGPPPGHAKGWRGRDVPPGHAKGRRGRDVPPGHAKGRVEVRGSAPPPPRAEVRAEVRVRAPEPPPPPRVEVRAGASVEAGGRVGR
jgi:hypothetical protein